MFQNIEEEIVFKEESNNSTEEPAYNMHKSPLNIKNLNTDVNEEDNMEDNIMVEEDTENESIQKTTQSRRPSTKYHDFYQFYMENEGLQ